MHISDEARRRFAIWLRTGQRPLASDIEFKFNPWHDPANGRFTFAGTGRYYSPGGRQAKLASDRSPAAQQEWIKPKEGHSLSPTIADSVFQSGPLEVRPMLQPASFAPDPTRSRRSNIRAFHDPMTLEQVFPGLRTAPGGILVATADYFLDFTGPSRDLTSELATRQARQLIHQIRTIDPSYHFESLGPPTTFQGQMNQLDFLRIDRAKAFMQKGELRPMQVEVVRLMQASADRAYDRGRKLLRAGRLPVRLSEQEALGNYIDREVRLELREELANARIDSSGSGPVRVNRRENEAPGSETSYRRPDARVGDVAFDVTLTAKTLATPQVRGFFNTEFMPKSVIIIRPRQLGRHNTYAISRPGAKR